MTPKEFIDENYFSLTIDCKREINEIYQALKDYAKIEQLTLTDVSSCYAIFDEEDNAVLIYQTEEKANKRMEEFKRSHEHTDFYVDTIKIH